LLALQALAELIHVDAFASRWQPLVAGRDPSRGADREHGISINRATVLAHALGIFIRLMERQDIRPSGSGSDARRNIAAIMVRVEHDGVEVRRVVTRRPDGGVTGYRTESGSHGGGIACYEVIGSTECADGFTLVAQGSVMDVWGNVHCVATDRLTPVGTNASSPCASFSNLGCSPDSWSFADEDFFCGTCCGAPVEAP
jgi:hypothetical protein